jgi:sec-independent protein translocase protein TatC
MRLPRRLENGQTAELVDHLGELRARILVSLLAICVGFVVAYVFHDQLIHWLNQPLPEARRRPVTLGVAEPFLTSIRVSLYAAIALAFPIVLWQAWAFLAPALDPRAARALAAFTGVAACLLAAGVAFGYVVALPAAVGFLTEYDSHLYDIQVRAGDYYTFATTVLLAVGLVFELPVFLLGLVRLGITSSRALRRNRRIGYVAVAALAVALPGVDPVTTLLEMGPLFALYESSIWLAAAFERRWFPAPRPTAPAS